MQNTSITCPKCQNAFEINDAFQHQLEQAKNQQIETLRKEFDQTAQKMTQQAVEAALAKERQGAQLEADKLRYQSENAKEVEKQLRQQYKAALDKLMEAEKAKEDAEISARKELLEKAAHIREEAAKKAMEDSHMKIRERDETISKLREQLITAKQTAEQGSQQLQGEVLELDVEQNLHANFPLDVVEEVKKGQRGSDVRQTVNHHSLTNCGLILWECKNAKNFQDGWTSKLKDQMAEEKAQFGVIVFNPTEGGGDDFRELAPGIWMVKPRHVTMLATLLRDSIIRVAITNRRNAAGKDTKIEMMYNYLTGQEFANRISYLMEAHNEMAKQLEQEKKQTHTRWAKQEKIIQKMSASMYGMYGDLQGIAGSEIVALPAINEEEGE
ncbi:MAG: DUF2130 domain-containing protein [Defluviitaleaceae bacterium]|nr:DUF2130 domain-containing protein [Defluviitaleaceae bacterium]